MAPEPGQIKVRWSARRVRLDAVEREDHDRDETDDVDDGVALMWVSYDGWPALAPSDLRAVPVGELRALGIEVSDEGHVLAWPHFPRSPHAEIGDWDFRPGPEWPPSAFELMVEQGGGE